MIKIGMNDKTSTKISISYFNSESRYIKIRFEATILGPELSDHICGVKAENVKLQGQNTKRNKRKCKANVMVPEG